MLRVSKRPLKWIPSNLSAIFAKKEDREVKHELGNLPTKERQELLRNIKKQKHQHAGFNWEDTANSMKYNAERGYWKHFLHNYSLLFGNERHNFLYSKMYNDTNRESLMLYCFRGELDLDWWDMMTDENVGGASKCKLRTSENGLSLMWFGVLENKPPELDWGKTSAWQSFATLYTKPWIRDYGRLDKLNIDQHNCFEIRLRGDGRKYDLDVHATRDWEDAEATWSTHIYTKGGYEWEKIRVPFHHMFQQYKDAKVRDQTVLPLDSITGLRFRVQDNVQGPFKLEIDYIAVTYDWSYHTLTNNIWRMTREEVKGEAKLHNYMHGQSNKNHYYFDPYNPALRKTNNMGQDTTSRRLDKVPGGKMH